MSDARDSRGVFETVYRENRWVFGSGAGSLPDATVAYRTLLEEMMRRHKVSSVLDFGCGDWQFSHLVDWGDAIYHGTDIVPSVISSNQAIYGSAFRRFFLTPENWLALPATDMIIIKDVLQHWPTPMIRDFLTRVLKRYPLALITNCCGPEGNVNGDIEMGGWRPLDLCAPPFNLSGEVMLTFSGVAPPPISAPWHKVTLAVIRGA